MWFVVFSTITQQGFFMFVLVEFQGISNLLEVSTHPAIFCMFWSTSLHHLTGPYQSIALLFSCLHHAHSWNMTKCSRQGCPCSSWWGTGLSASVSPWHKEISGCEAWSPTVTGKHLACKPIHSPQNRVAIQSVCSRSMMINVNDLKTTSIRWPHYITSLRLSGLVVW